MDPIERINIRGDSTFALLLEAQRRGHALAYYTPDRLALRGGAGVRDGAAARRCATRSGDHFTLGRAAAHRARRASTWCCCGRTRRSTSPTSPRTHLLERIHPKTLVVNDPAQVRNAPEKMFVMEFPDLMPPTLITRDLAEIKAFRAEHGDIVMKPLYGKGGEAVFRLAREDLNFGSLYDLFAVTFREPWVVQKFLPAVSDGDKRIILVDGEFAGAVNRVPAADDLRSNMVRGGAAEGDRPDRARARDLRAHRAGAARARPPLRRHRRDRRLPHRDQRHLADRHPRDQVARRPRRRGDDLGRDRGEAELRRLRVRRGRISSQRARCPTARRRGPGRSASSASLHAAQRPGTRFTRLSIEHVNRRDALLHRRLSLQRPPVPPRVVGAGLVGALQELHSSVVRVASAVRTAS